MATKSYEFDLWAAKDNDGLLYCYCSKPEKSEEYGMYTESKDLDYDDINSGGLLKDSLSSFAKELNLTNINEPYKFKAKLIFEDLPDNPDNPDNLESDNINNQKQEIMPENNQTPLAKAQEVVYTQTDCVLLSKEEYQELCKYKGLYLDLKGSIEQISNTFKDK